MDGKDITHHVFVKVYGCELDRLDHQSAHLCAVSYGCVVTIIYQPFVLFGRMHRSAKENVGPREYLSSLSEKYKFNASIVSKVEAMQAGYCGWRAVRGDGNCYYRY